jgi:hypothetical protein
MKKTTADYWAPRINAEWRKSVEGILNVGRQLIAAKEACEHGEFLRLFKGGDDVVGEPLPFTVNTAERIMAVARHPVLSKSAHVQSLPQSWGTLYELTKVPEVDLAEAIATGKITAEITRSQAAALHADPVDNSQLHWAKNAAASAVGRVRVPRWIVALARWSDDRSYGYALGAVSIESDGFNATAVATDGRRMAVVTVPQSEGMDDRLPRVEPFLVPVDELANAIKRVPPKWKPGTRRAETCGDGSECFVIIEANGDGTATVAAADGSGSPVTVNLCGGRFPDWREPIAAVPNGEAAAILRCNPEMLADVSFLAKSAGAHSIAVRFSDKPALVGEFETIDGCTGRVLVMGQGEETTEWPERERERIATVRHYAAKSRTKPASSVATTA